MFIEDVLMVELRSRIAFFQNECAPTRMPHLESLSKLPNVELKAFSGTRRSLGRVWHADLRVGLSYEILRDVRILSRVLCSPCRCYADSLEQCAPHRPVQSHVVSRVLDSAVSDDS
jgi:hypothetical protein